MPHRYCQDGEDAVATCVLEDMVLLYHRPSGQTHMVISPVPEILAALAEGAALTASEVHGELSRHYDLGPAEEALPQIEAHLAELTALGLVRLA
ncbi:HPr-rel-A system PqqD family peptide chaperone [Sphingobium sp. Sx8-8]|uniref:HPr-rel-A system PqqD family peptide chaperone n=1 Tax=Sphingobium sp. Sx8-8 TaxID=2933617 RepID=UPI001F584B0A|nr:HPr-rel-A system PqqD family peptide chaperone [Sphingobium sp. Sx8-8]